MSYHIVGSLKEEIFRQLASRMRPDCVLLNTPDHINIGDQMIWQGELDFLEELKIHPQYQTSNFHFDWREFSKDTLILLHGGGNFGDVWRLHQEFKREVVKKYRENDILVFPQSVQYKSTERLLEDAKIFSEHDNVTICARDLHSYELLKKHFNNEILLVPDMAFCSTYSKNLLLQSNKKLLFKRLDREINSKLNYESFKAFDILDWPSFEPSFQNFGVRVLEKLNRLYGKHFVPKNIPDTTFGLGAPWNRENLIQLGVNFLSEYQLVISTRLHGHILSLLLEIPTVMIDNDYGKNSRFYNTWLKENESSVLVSNQDELDALLKKEQYIG